VAEQIIFDRFANVIERGQSALKTASRAGSRYETVDEEMFFAWRSQGSVLLDSTFGAANPYTRSFDSHTTVDNVPIALAGSVRKGMGVLRAALEDLQNGWALRQVELIHAEVFSDFLDMSSYLLEGGGYKDPSAVLAGGVLEQHLRKLSQKEGISIDKQGGRSIEPQKASILNDELRKKSVISQAEWRSVQSWLDYRNDAAHGNYSNYDLVQIRQMIDGIREFIIRHPA
jgi:hypothetical protein